MFVVSLIINGTLEKNAIYEKHNEAMEVAQKWYFAQQGENKKETFISIDQGKPGQEQTVPYAVLRYDEDSQNMIFILADKSSQDHLPFKGSPSAVSIEKYLIPLVDLIVVLTDHLRKNKR